MLPLTNHFVEWTTTNLRSFHKFILSRSNLSDFIQKCQFFYSIEPNKCKQNVQYGNQKNYQTHIIKIQRKQIFSMFSINPQILFPSK